MAPIASRGRWAGTLLLGLVGALLAGAAPARAHESVVCAAADGAWAAAQASGDRVRMARVAGRLPRGCAVWSRAQAALQANGGGFHGLGPEQGGHPGSPGVTQPTVAGAPRPPPVTPSTDPMSGVPASHEGDAPPR